MRFGRGYAAWTGAPGAGFEFGGGRGGRGFGEEGGRRRRLFDGGELKLVLLKLIADAPRHGYDLIRAMEERTEGGYAPSPGVVYPTIALLAEMELIAESEADGARKRFAITPAGMAYLAERAGEIDRLFARIDSVASVRERTDAVPVRRAMHNLRAVILHRLGRDGVSQDLIHRAVALIDEAAAKIERL